MGWRPPALAVRPQPRRCGAQTRPASASWALRGRPVSASRARRGRVEGAPQARRGTINGLYAAMNRPSMAGVGGYCRRMSRLAIPVVIVLSLAFATSACAATKTVTKVRTGPSGSEFYTPPSPLPGKKHGDLIWARTLTGPAVVPGASKTKLVLYRSQGVDGKGNAVSGIVSIPKGKAPKKGWPVITYAHGTTGAADQCAPSRDAVGTPVHGYNAYISPLLTRWLKAGYAVVRTDYEGLGTPGPHPYLIGNSEGRATLDIARAARKLNRDIGSELVIAGHSQ